LLLWRFAVAGSGGVGGAELAQQQPAVAVASADGAAELGAGQLAAGRRGVLGSRPGGVVEMRASSCT
jgi:hypothetical protein